MPPSEPSFADLLRAADAVVDVRSPGEFSRGHIPRAVNIPLFSDGERAEVGILYKRLGRDPAIKRGLEVAGGKIAALVLRFEPYRGGRIAIYCARGGMRSTSVASLLKSLDYRVEPLPGGYKAWRQYLLAELARRAPPRLIVVHGQTGVGKTLLLKRLDNALDLEEVARHRSSLFGAVNLQPRTQQQFEGELLAALERLDFSRPVWVEGESRKVGTVIIPEALRAAMQAAICVLVTATLETRVSRIVAEYTGGGPPTPETLAQLEAALRALTAHFGAARTEQLAALLRAGDLPPLVRVLLAEYYDPRYEHAMRNYRYALTLPSEDLEQAAAALRSFTLATLAAGAPGGRPGEELHLPAAGRLP
jgi:tRNA 2-selenouridine synthase